MENKTIIIELLKKEKYDFDDLCRITEILRSPGGCPWDIEQTHKSIRNDFIEETYEVIEAIDTQNRELLREELGDVLLQVTFHARIEEEQQCFDINDVTDGICKKLIHRHPHVFGEVNLSSSEEVLKNWEKIKSDEKNRNTVSQKLHAVPKMLPALMRATKVGKRAKCFDFKDSEEALKKVREEICEIEEAMENRDGDTEQINEEIGDLLLAVTCFCRKVGVDAEQSLAMATDKFIKRFENMEEYFVKKDIRIDDISQSQLDNLWNNMKND
jgi:tetrapyrrole methylase family protein/MazG family protein